MSRSLAYAYPHNSAPRPPARLYDVRVPASRTPGNLARQASLDCFLGDLRTATAQRAAVRAWSLAVAAGVALGVLIGLALVILPHVAG